MTGIATTEGGMAVTMAAPFDDLVAGESVAVDGACLTVRDIHPGRFTVDVVVTTRDRTNVGAWTVGRRVNLERALAVGDRFGGHLVQGHVDGVGEIRRVTARDDALLIDVSVPAEVWSLSVLHGSIAIDGVSMTVNALPDRGVVQLSVVPFTRVHTTLGDRVVGDRVHVEGDLLGKFVQRLLTTRGDGGT